MLGGKVGIIKANWIIVPIFFLSLLSACGGGDGWVTPFTMDWSVALGYINGDGFLDLAADKRLHQAPQSDSR